MFFFFLGGGGVWRGVGAVSGVGWFRSFRAASDMRQKEIPLHMAF